MPYHAYILYSSKIDRFYIGSCENMTVRIQQHNASRNKSTKTGVPWEIKKLFSVYLLGCKGRFPEPIFGYFSAHSAAMRFKMSLVRTRKRPFSPSKHKR